MKTKIIAILVITLLMVLTSGVVAQTIEINLISDKTQQRLYNFLKKKFEGKGKK